MGIILVSVHNHVSVTGWAVSCGSPVQSMTVIYRARYYEYYAALLWYIMLACVYAA